MREFLLRAKGKLTCSGVDRKKNEKFFASERDKAYLVGKDLVEIITDDEPKSSAASGDTESK